MTRGCSRPHEIVSSFLKDELRYNHISCLGVYRIVDTLLDRRVVTCESEKLVKLKKEET